MAIFRRFFKFITTFWLILSMTILLLSSSIFLFKQVYDLSAQLLASTIALKELKIRHKNEIKKAIVKERAKARLRRILVAIPVFGTVAFTAFEIADYKEWKKQNPNQSSEKYFCENAHITNQIIDEVLAELPASKFSREELISKLVNRCEKNNSELYETN